MNVCTESTSSVEFGSSSATPSSLSAEDRAPFFQRVDWLAFGLTVTIVLIVYLFTLAPEVTLGGSGVYATGAAYAGVNCPPGLPLWTLYAWLFTKLLPIGNIAWRIGVSSAVAGALAGGIIALIVSRGGAMILEGMDGFRRLKPEEENRLRIIAGLVAGTAFGFQRSFWGRAVIVEPAAFSVLLLTMTLSLLLRWTHSPERARYICAAFLVYGLALSSELYLAVASPGLPFVVLFRRPSLGRDIFFAISAILISAIVAFNLGFLTELAQASYPLWFVFKGLAIISTLVWLTMIAITRRLLTEWKTLCVSGFVFICGCSLYLDLPLASMTNPPVDWGHPCTVEGFIHTISAGQYERLNPAGFSDNPFGIADTAWLYLNVTVRNPGIIHLLPAVIPFFFLWRVRVRTRGWLLGLSAVHFCLSFLLSDILNCRLDNNGMWIGDVFFAPSHVILVIWEGYGLCLLGTILARKRADVDSFIRVN